MKESEQIINYLKENVGLNEEELIDAIKALGLTGDKEAIPFLMNELKKFNSLSWDIRNAIAISLGDLGADEAVPFLMEVVKDDKHKGWSGSFLYAIAIKPLECKKYFLDFVELLSSESLEIRNSAEDLIEFYHEKVSDEIKRKALEILNRNKIILESKNKGTEKYGSLGYIEHMEELLKKH